MIPHQTPPHHHHPDLHQCSSLTSPIQVVHMHFSHPHHQHHHFILPEAPPYPSPLTPRTPNTPSEFNTGLVPNQFAGNDSGYDTSSYYSNSSASTMSPNMMSSPNVVLSNRVPHHHNNYQHHHVSLGPLRPPPHLEDSPVSPPVYTRHYHEMEASTNQFVYNNYNNIAENPEEEELLDAIATWQEQSDD